MKMMFARLGALVLSLGLLSAGSALSQTPAPAAGPGARRPPSPAPAPPAARATAETPAATMPEPPIPSQHLAQAGIPQCGPAVEQLGRAALTAEYNAQSLWNQANPSQHVFQSVAGIKNPRNNPPTGMVAIIAAPTAPEKCDAVAVEVYPLAKSCTDVQRAMAKGGELENSLEDIKVITDAQKRRLFLMPGFGNTCVAVSVNSFFGP